MTKTKEVDKTAYYREAGHAVMALYIKQPFEKVTVEQSYDWGKSLGEVFVNKADKLLRFSYTDFTILPKEMYRPVVEDAIRIDFAGMICEKKLKGHIKQESKEMESKRLLAQKVCCSDEETEAYLKYLQMRTQNFFNIEQHWRGVEALAYALHTEPDIYYDRVKEIMLWDLSFIRST